MVLKQQSSLKLNQFGIREVWVVLNPQGTPRASAEHEHAAWFAAMMNYCSDETRRLGAVMCTLSHVEATQRAKGAGWNVIKCYVAKDVHKLYGDGYPVRLDERK